MEDHLIFVYSAYCFTFFALFVIGVKSLLAFKKVNKDIYNFDSSGCLQEKGEEGDLPRGFRARWLFLRIQGW